MEYVLGNTQYVATLIQNLTGGDIYRIEPKVSYTTNHQELVALARSEQDNDIRPELKNKISDFEHYDIIFIGYPIWWNDMPQILYSFLKLYNFQGKTVIPFSTHGGSGFSSTVSTIKNKLSSATVIENVVTLSRNNMESAPEKVEAWLKEINMMN